MKNIFTSIILFSILKLSSQNIIINEVLPSNTNIDTLNDGSTPDWIELYNQGTTNVNLKNYSLRDDLSSRKNEFLFPDTIIKPGQYCVVYAMGDKKPEMQIADWQTLVQIGDSCKYLVPQQNLTQEWKQLKYDDSNWEKAELGIGYGYTRDSTVITKSGNSLYLRKKFTVTNIDQILAAILHIDYDDGFIAYLNGTEIARSGITDINPQFDAIATPHFSKLFSGRSLDSYTIANIKQTILLGENILAIEVHNSTETPENLTIAPFLSLGYSKKITNNTLSYFVPLKTSFLTSRFMASFKIDADNDTVFLFDATNRLVDKMIIVDVPQNISQGKSAKNHIDLHWFNQPTIESENSANAFTIEKLSKPQFSHPAGTYHEQFKIGISSKDKKAAIYYTTDGSEPSPQNGLLYTDSITIGKSCVVRACSSKNNTIQSECATASYLVLLRKISLPIVSISVKNADFFDDSTGIYVKGKHASIDHPYFGANFWQNWERKAHIEFIEPNGNQAFSVDLGVKIGGQYSRANPQKTLKLYMRNKYGDDKIRYRIFKDKPIDEFDNLVLRNAGGDCNFAHMRDGLVSTLVRNIDIERQAYRPAVVFINGKYWGIQNLREKISSDYFNDNWDVQNDSLTVLEKRVKIKEGSNIEYNMMMQFIFDYPMNDSANYAKIEQQIDIQNYINYINTELYIVNLDWPGNNIRYWRTTGGKWRWILYDADFAFDNCFNNAQYGSTEAVSQKMLEFATSDTASAWPNPEWSTRLFRKLLESPKFKVQFMNSMADRLNTTFRADSVVKIVDSLANNIKEEMYYHSATWQTKYSVWQSEIEKIKTFAKNRPQYVWSNYQDFFGASGLFALKLEISDAKAGTIALNSIKIGQFPWTGNYFNNIPITVTAVPKPGYRFIKWEGANTSDQKQITITTDQICNLKAIFEYDAALEPHISINELMYNDAPNKNSGDWIELYNSGDNDVDLTNWKLKNETQFSNFAIPQGTVLKAKQYLVFSTDSSAFRSIYNQMAIGNLSFKLENDKDEISLYDVNQNLIDRVSYTSTRPWPAKADGMGYSLELQTIKSNNPAQWKAITLGGTPNKKNSIASESKQYRIMFSEINYNDNDENVCGDWFEIYNSENETIDISRWMIEDKSGNKMIIPNNTTLAAQHCLLLVNEPQNFSQVYPTITDFIHTPISLSSDSDQLLLFDETEKMIDSVQFSSRNPWPILANGTGFSLNLISPDLDNSLPTSWTTSGMLGSPGSAQFKTNNTDFEADDVHVYPNHTKAMTTIIAPVGTKLQLNNIMGHCLWAETTTSTQTEVNIEKLANGVYYLTYSNLNKNKSILIIKE